MLGITCAVLPAIENSSCSSAEGPQVCGGNLEKFILTCALALLSPHSQSNSLVYLAVRVQFGMMAAIRSGEMTAVSLKEAVGELKTVEEHRYNTAKLFFS